jgi:hypothetical protein
MLTVVVDLLVSLHSGCSQLEVRSEGLALGKYKVRVDASSEGSKGFLETIVTMTAPMAVSNANVAVFESDGTLVELRENMNLGESMTMSASDSQKLKVGDEGLEIELESSTLSLGSESHKLEVVVKSANGEVVSSAQ